MTSPLQDLIQNTQSGPPFPSLETTACYMPLDDFGVLSVSGEDSQSFLQSLLTNDIALLGLNQSQYSGLCNPKGRLLALFIIIRSDETAYQLIMPRALCDSIAKRLAMYKLRSKVSIDNDSQQLICLGLTQGQQTLFELTDTEYTGGCTTINDVNYHHTKLPATIARWLVVCPKDTVSDIAEHLNQQHYQCQHGDYWHWLDITTGLASIFSETQERFTPQQLNLDLTEAVNFKKGCYPGQEVVARLHYLGKPSRRLFIAKTDSKITVKIGEEVMTSQGSVAGHYVSVIQQQNTIWCLVSLKIKDLNSALVLADDHSLIILSDLSD